VRGKIARALAGKLSIAARLDYYSGEIDPSLVEKLETKVRQIKASNPQPPQRMHVNETKNKKKGGSKCLK
jgi:nucleolar protein 56